MKRATHQVATIASVESQSNWKLAAILGALTIVILLVLYRHTALSAVAIWERSETFAHGYIIFPISLYLIWARREALAKLRPHSDLRGLLVLVLFGFGWLLAEAGKVSVISQYCLVAMIPVAVWTLLGAQVARNIAFPLGFLFFSVPAGEFLIPHMMEFTANFVVAALQLTGIPVYREGTFFTIPSGQWSVVEGCSGLRYLIASFTLGTLYAYLTYRSTKRRLIFSVLALIVPVIANGLRAYMIVMIAHLSDMKLALGVDHLIYGWVFFGIVMTLLFWIGAFWREDHEEQAVDNVKSSTDDLRLSTSRPFFLVSVLIIVVAAIWPVYTSYLDGRLVKTTGLALVLPNVINGWVRQNEALSNWQPHYIAPDASVAQTYEKNGVKVSVYLGYYRTQRQAATLITSQNYMIEQKHPVWNNVGEVERNVLIQGHHETIRQTLLRAPNQRLLVWSWNSLAGKYTVNPYLAKLLLAKARLLGQYDDGAVIIIDTTYEETPESAAKILKAFISDTLPAIQQSLDQVSKQ